MMSRRLSWQSLMVLSLLVGCAKTALDHGSRPRTTDSRGGPDGIAGRAATEVGGMGGQGGASAVDAPLIGGDAEVTAGDSRDMPMVEVGGMAGQDGSSAVDAPLIGSDAVGTADSSPDRPTVDVATTGDSRDTRRVDVGSTADGRADVQAPASCGQAGEPCCIGKACANGGCCVHDICLPAQAPCPFGGICTNGACGTCGGHGMACCPGFACTESHTTCSSFGWASDDPDGGISESDLGATCLPCGGDGQRCCAGNACLDGGCCVPAADRSTPPTCKAAGQPCGNGIDGICADGACGSCGAYGASCCDGYRCTAPNTACSTMNGITRPLCTSCGAIDRLCCDSATFTGFGTCGGDAVCIPYHYHGAEYVCGTSCGHEGQPCCPGSKCSDFWLVCQQSVDAGSSCVRCGRAGLPCCAQAPCQSSTCDPTGYCS